MPARTKNTYTLPGGRGVFNTKTKTVTGGKGTGPPPAGTKRVSEPSYDEVPVVTTSPSGQVTTSGYSSQKAARRATRRQRTAIRTERRKTRALNLTRRNAAQRRRIASQSEARVKRTEAAIKADSQRVTPKTKFSPQAKQDLKPKTFKGLKTAGSPNLKELQVASSRGKLKTNQRGYLTTPAVRKAASTIKRIESRASTRHSRAPLPGLDPEQTQVARTVLKQGQKARATSKEKLAAVETGLVESSFRNLPYGDADSQGWRQERTSQYGTGPAGANNVKAGAKRFYQESISDTGGTRGRGQTAGELAQTIQGSAYPERYDERAPEAKAILHAYNKGKLKPRESRKLAAAKAQASELGLKGLTKGKHQNYLKVFGKQVAHQLQLVKAKKYTKGPGKLVVGDSDVSAGHEPEIAARLKLLSAKIHKPIYIISGHRSPQHSVEVGGFADDPHTEGKAADIGIGSALRESAGQISEAEYESVGLHRPYYPASAAEINHVELLNGGTPSTGGGAIGGVTVAGAIPVSTGAISASGRASAAGRKRRKGRRPTQAQKARRTFRRLKQAGIGVGEAKPAEGSSDTLKALEAKYGA